VFSFSHFFLFLFFVLFQYLIPTVFLIFSMGGLIALLSALEVNCQLPLPSSAQQPFATTISWQALVVSAPAIVLDPELATPPLKAAANLLGSLAPKLVLDGLPPSFISRNEQAVQTMINDTTIWHGGVRARVGQEMLRGGKFVCEHATALKMPLLAVHGGSDKVYFISLLS
jgi:alpha-beta hydrolase superfamily lysophospholipase